MIDEIKDLAARGGELMSDDFSSSVLRQIVGAVMGVVFIGASEKKELRKLKDQHFIEVAKNLIQSGNLTNYEVYKLKNFSQVAKMADELLSNGETESHKGEQTENNQGEIPDAAPSEFDFDWFMRMFDAVGTVSNADMQQLWAKVLAGEVQAPGSFSLRTIETVRNLTAAEAKLFLDLSQYLLMGDDEGFSFISTTENLPDINDHYGITSESLFVLQDCGLVSGIRIDTRLFMDKNDVGYYLSHGDKLIVMMPKNSKSDLCSIYGYPLTRAGEQLLSATGLFVNESYFLDIGYALKRTFYDAVKTTIRPIVFEGQETYGYDASVDYLDGYTGSDEAVRNVVEAFVKRRRD